MGLVDHLGLTDSLLLTHVALLATPAECSWSRSEERNHGSLEALAWVGLVKYVSGVSEDCRVGFNRSSCCPAGSRCDVCDAA